MNNNKQLLSILDENFEIGYIVAPIGHHELGRHYVYHVSDKYHNEYILKIYGKKNRWIKEVKALELFEGVISCPRIIKKGVLDDGTEWVLLNKIPGVILEKVWNKMNVVNKKEIIRDMGVILGKIHSTKSFDYYGPSKEDNDTAYANLLEYRKEKDRIILERIQNEELAEKDEILRAYEEMIKYYSILSSNENTRLCHHDFSPRNTMVIKEGNSWKISGILDFEHSYPNDPDIDFTDLYQTIFIKEPNLEFYFLDGYLEHMKINKNLSKKMRYYLYNKGLFICSWSYNVARQYYDEGIKLIKWLLSTSKKVDT